MANVPQRRLEADKRSKEADKKYNNLIKYAEQDENLAFQQNYRNPTPENQEESVRAASDLDTLRSLRAYEGGYDPYLNPKKKGTGYFKKGGPVKSSASKRADGCAVRGKTKGRIV